MDLSFYGFIFLWTNHLIDIYNKINHSIIGIVVDDLVVGGCLDHQQQLVIGGLVVVGVVIG